MFLRKVSVHVHMLPSHVAHIRSIFQVEKLARTLFLWKIDVHDQKEKVYEMRRWNEALVTNMLPEHVARHFLGHKKRDEVREYKPAAHGPQLSKTNRWLEYSKAICKVMPIIHKENRMSSF